MAQLGPEMQQYTRQHKFVIMEPTLCNVRWKEEQVNKVIVNFEECYERNKHELKYKILGSTLD